MDSYDLSHKLAYIGRLSPIPFATGPEYTNSVPGVPVLSMVRIFVEPANWSDANMRTIAREIARVLGPGEQFDIGITHTSTIYRPDLPAAGNVARMIKLDPDEPRVVLLIRDENGDRAFQAFYPRLRFEPIETDFWRSIYDIGAVKIPQQE
ncbi:MAG TPA: hypothetical protein VFB58_07225 [Chloroflexota bacterium]|nr:hypothetical protein [Chloroflexota bacterium]